MNGPHAKDRELILQLIQDGPGAHKLNTAAISAFFRNGTVRMHLCTFEIMSGLVRHPGELGTCYHSCSMMFSRLKAISC